MKVCIISNLFSKKSAIPLYTKGLASGLIPIISKDNLSIVSEKEDSNNSHLLPCKIYPCWNHNLLYPFQIFKMLIKIRPDLVHIQHEFFVFGGISTAIIFPLLLLLIKLLGIQTIITLHNVPCIHQLEIMKNDFFLSRYVSFSKSFLRFFVRIVCSFSNCIIVHSRYTKECLTYHYRINSLKVAIIPHGVRFMELRPETSNRPNKTILFFGFITPSKGLDILLRAFKLIRSDDIQLVIAGGKHNRDKNYFENIRERCISNSICFKGFVKEDDVPKIMADSDLVVLPYKTQISSSGVLSLAFGCGKPVIVSPHSIFKEMVNNGKNGIVLSTLNEQELSHAIISVLRDEAFLNQLSKGASETGRKLSWNNIALETYDLYSKVLNSALTHGTSFQNQVLANVE